MALPEELALAIRVARAIEALGLRYLIGGSLASSLHGVPRATNDADFVAEIPPGLAAEFVAALGNEFYADVETIENAARTGESFNVIHETGFKIDIFVFTPTPLHLEEMHRREAHDLGDRGEERVYFATAEDTVLQKLQWFKKGGGVSDRQWKDILGVLKVQAGRVDLEYLRRWAHEIDVEELLALALRDAGT